MKLYGFQPSPFGTRVRLAMRHKGLSFDIAPPTAVDPKTAPFLAPSPMEVPTLVLDDGAALSGSTVILDYLEDAYPKPSLRPDSPVARARARMLMQTPDTYMQNAPRNLFGMADPTKRDLAAIDESFGMIVTALQFVDARLDDGAWAIGGQVSIADCALIPMLNAISLLAVIHGRPDVISKHLRLASYWAAVQHDPINAALIAEQLAGLPAPLQSFARSAVQGSAA